MNIYAHFPFCRRKCSYCSLYSRVGHTPSERERYVAHITTCLSQLSCAPHEPTTIYFGGGSPALCDLTPLTPHIRRLRTCDEDEFTVELHPLDVTTDKLLALRDLGVNRISMGVQSLNDRVLQHMGRDYTVAEAARAFTQVKKHFDNAGIDLIVGYPGPCSDIALLSDWGLRHCSVYALQNERNLPNIPDDETTMNQLAEAGRVLKSMGLLRYEISNYAVPGFECRHNFAVWRGEDYIGIGDGAFGRIGCTRTQNFGGKHPHTETLSPERDTLERTLFRLRTRDGLDTAKFPHWKPILDRFVAEGALVTHDDPTTYYLTPRGAEVCDTILAELV